jgi:hypothetical protein
MTYSKTLKTYHNHVPTRSNTSQHVPNRSKMLWHHITSPGSILYNSKNHFKINEGFGFDSFQGPPGRPPGFPLRLADQNTLTSSLVKSQVQAESYSNQRLYIGKCSGSPFRELTYLKKTMRSTTTSACLERGACWGWNVESKETASIDVNLARI